jgi:DNA segregation ATPase FtsK/SpoIIIE, S-DNA-T family
MSTTPTSTKSPEQQAVVITLAHKLASLGLTADFVDPISVGPIVSVYRFQPKGSTKVSQLESLSQDFAVVLGAEDVMVKRMPGESSVGVFVPNRERQWVKWYNHCTVDTTKFRLPMILGIDHLGKLVVEELTLMPHLLVAGSTGGGKSTLLNSIIGGVILNYSEEDIELVMSDTKGVEFTQFEKARNLRSNIATSVSTTIERFDELIDEMNRRLKTFGQTNTRNILEYNQARQGSKARLPYILVIIDELADLLLDRRRVPDPDDPEGNRTITLGTQTSRKLASLAQKARATGIHIIASTQRPSVKLLEGDIKANFPARLAFRLPSEADSRTVLGHGGAEHLLSRGDMLFINPNKPGITRIHAPLATLDDIKAAISFAEARR